MSLLLIQYKSSEFCHVTSFCNSYLFQQLCLGIHDASIVSAARPRTGRYVGLLLLEIAKTREQLSVEQPRTLK